MHTNPIRQHEEMLGGASGSDVALTAYVTSALAKAAGRFFPSN